MRTTTTPKQSGAATVPELGMAMETGAKEWKLFFSTGLGQHPRQRNVSAGRLDCLAAEIAKAKQHFGLSADAKVSSCYEAGRDGFWLHRALVEMGIDNQVIDSSSLEVKRQRRRTKTDRVDGTGLLRMLWRYHNGETAVFRIVRVPSQEEEDERQLERTLVTAKEDRTRIANRIQGLLFTYGIVLASLRDVPKQLKRVRQWNGKALPEGLLRRVEVEWSKFAQLTELLAELEAERRRLLKEAKKKSAVCAAKLMQLRGIGENAGWLFSTEFFAWREFKNRRQVGGLAGLSPTPYQSGNDSREQGMSKAGNRWIRGLVIEIAWGWLRYQPQSELSRWYQQRFGSGSSRVKRIGIVAVARKMLIELWRYLETGEPPKGALLKG
jgi:transposase